MRKICFGKNITSVNSKMSNLTDNIKDSLREVYRFPQNLVDVSNCFNGCVNLTKFEAELPNSIKNMSSSFEGCGNFYKNVAIPSNCIDMSRSFKGSGLKGSINIPDKVIDLMESFKDTNLQAVRFDENISSFNNFQESFMNCQSLSYIYGTLPENIKNGSSAFKNTGITEVKFLKENSFINNADKMFEHCKSLISVGNIKSNSFLHTWNGCSNLKSIGIINGVLNFNNTFNGCNNYSDVVYLHPYFDGTDNSYLSIGDSDRNFLNNQALRIYGLGHGLENELNFQNAHLEKGDYISGYCDPDDFEKTQGDTYSNFYNWSGNTTSLVIPKYFRTNLLDDSTKSSVVFNHTFKNKVFEDVIIYGGDISMHAFNGARMNNLKIYPETKINNYGFHNMSSNTLTIPNHGKTINIGEFCFKDTNIKDVFIYSDINNIEKSAFLSFKGNLFLGNINNVFSTTFKSSYGNITSYDKTKNHTINIVGENAFSHMRGVIDIPIKNIGNNAFYNANQSSINLAITTHIGENAFYNSGITSLKTSDDINLINNSLHGMNSLTDLNIYNLNIYQFGNVYPSSLKNVVLRNNAQDANSTNKLYSVQNITMLNGGDIANNQFKKLSNLTYFYTKGNPNIGNNAFNGCSNLISINRMVGNIGRNAFKGCTNLVELDADDIVQGALSGCLNLKRLTVPNLDAYFANNSVKHIGRLWGYEFYETTNGRPREPLENETLLYYNTGYNHYYWYFNMSNKLEYAEIDFHNVYDANSVNFAFANIKSLKKIDSHYFCYGNCVNSPVVGCSNLTDYNIRFPINTINIGRSIINGIHHVKNVNFNFAGVFSGTLGFEYFVEELCSYSIQNVNFGNIRFNNSREIVFNNANFGNYSERITILPNVSHGNVTAGYTHSNFGYNFIVPTSYIGINSYFVNNKFYNIPNYSMRLNGKTIYFGNNVNISRFFFNNRSYLNVYVEDVYDRTNYVTNNSRYITVYYSNISTRPKFTDVSEISNDGKNYYYANNINVIYEPNYNYANYVSNIK